MKKLSVFLLVFVALTTFSYAEQLKVTPEHPFYLNGEWIEAKNLKIGDKLKTIDGKTAVIKNIQKVKTEKPITVYNLEDDFYLHNYVVDKGLVVHNSKVPAHSTNSEESIGFYKRVGDKDVFEFHWKGESVEFTGRANGVERMIIDDLPFGDKKVQLILKNFQDDVVTALDAPAYTWTERKGLIKEGLSAFSKNMRESLPFIGKRNFKGYIMLDRERKNMEWLRYLSQYEDGPIRLSELVATGDLDCCSQSLAIQNSLKQLRGMTDPKSSLARAAHGWELYQAKKKVMVDGKPKFVNDLHTFLVKRLVTGQYKNNKPVTKAILIDPTGQDKLGNDWIMPWESFIKKHGGPITNLNTDPVPCP